MRTEISRSEGARMVRSDQGAELAFVFVVCVAVLATLLVRAYGIPLDASLLGLPG
jgi:hypothetical protein